MWSARLTVAAQCQRRDSRDRQRSAGQTQRSCQTWLSCQGAGCQQQGAADVFTLQPAGSLAGLLKQFETLAAVQLPGVGLLGGRYRLSLPGGVPVSSDGHTIGPIRPDVKHRVPLC